MQRLIDASIWIGVFLALFFALEVLRHFEYKRRQRHPSSFCEQSSCVRILRDPRPFDYEVDRSLAIPGMTPEEQHDHHW